MRYNLEAGRFEDLNLSPTKPAVWTKDTVLNWEEFRLAVELEKKLLATSKIPIIVQESSLLKTVIRITAALDLKIPYVPLDATLPEMRVQSILQEINGFKNTDQFAYIIFTSGSTGKPKGVQISREALNSFVNWLDTDFGFNSQDVFLNQVSF